MAWTRHSVAEEQEFMSELDAARDKYLVCSEEQFGKNLPPEASNGISQNESVPLNENTSQENVRESQEVFQGEEACEAVDVVEKEKVDISKLVENLNNLGKIKEAETTKQTGAVPKSYLPGRGNQEELSTQLRENASFEEFSKLSETPQNTPTSEDEKEKFSNLFSNKSEHETYSDTIPLPNQEEMKINDESDGNQTEEIHRGK